MTKTTTALLAAAAGALFLAQPSFASEPEKTDGKMKCEGVNSCKGSSACHNASHECAGKNECKGKGFLMLTPDECKAAKDKLGEGGLSRPLEAPCLGVGVGLRSAHQRDVLERGAAGALQVDFFEAISENHLVPGGRPRRIVEDVRAHAPVVLHGVSLNVGSSDPLDLAYVDALGALARRVEAPWVSDHLCWTGVRGRNTHDLLPLPHTEAALRHVAARVRAVQERLGRRIALENPSTYVRFACDEMSEWEFLVGVAVAADCGILLDVNNVFVNAWNHGLDADAYLDAIPPERVFEIHLAGHSESGPLLVDTHDHPIRDEVLALYERALRRLGPVSTLVEWDDRLPTYAELEAEAARVRAVLERARARAAA